MSFTVTGVLKGHIDKHRYSLTWENGQLRGDLAALTSAQVAVVGLLREGRRVVIPGFASHAPGDYSDPLAASAFLGEHVFEWSGAEWTGDVPSLPDVPEGAFA